MALGAACDPMPAVAHAPRRVPAPQLCARHVAPIPESLLEACKHRLVLAWQHSTQQSVTKPQPLVGRTSPSASKGTSDPVRQELDQVNTWSWATCGNRCQPVFNEHQGYHMVWAEFSEGVRCNVLCSTHTGPKCADRAEVSLSELRGSLAAGGARCAVLRCQAVWDE